MVVEAKRKPVCRHSLGLRELTFSACDYVYLNIDDNYTLNPYPTVDVPGDEL
jgi:hypothetical protein